MKQIAESANILSEFCGVRDLENLIQAELKGKFSIEQADIAVLFGGSILCGGDVFAKVIQNNLAKKYIIVGGAGHTTENLRKKMSGILKKNFSEQATEAELFNQYLQEKYNLQADFLERESTNCGNNITFLHTLLKENNLTYDSAILIQDSTMQRRMAATWRKQIGEQILINYAAYKVKIIFSDGELKFEKIPLGMWTIEKYIELLLGEISRLQDNSEGYGSNGKNFIAHVEVPEKVLIAFNFLKNHFEVRKANPIFADKKISE